MPLVPAILVILATWPSRTQLASQLISSLVVPCTGKMWRHQNWFGFWVYYFPGATLPLFCCLSKLDCLICFKPVTSSLWQQGYYEHNCKQLKKMICNIVLELWARFLLNNLISNSCESPKNHKLPLGVQMGFSLSITCITLSTWNVM